jgi:hypothetical protein
MNTQPPRQHEVLSDEERELARVVRALPGGEPPATLDSLILKAASDAVASSHSPKNPRWTRAWLGTSALWLGTAAASILTVGIGLQVFQSMDAPIYQLPDDQNVMSKQEVDNSHKSDTITVEMMPASEPAPTSPPPPPASALAESEKASDNAAFSIPKAMTPEVRAREQFARQETADASFEKKIDDSKDGMRRDQAAEQDWIPQTAGAVASVAAPPPAPVAAAPSILENYSKRKELESVVVTGSRIKSVQQESSQPVQVVSRATIDKNKLREAAKSDKDNSGLIQTAKTAAPVDSTGNAAKASSPAIAADTASENQELERVEVTGSRIKPDNSQANPVLVIPQKQINEERKQQIAEINATVAKDAKLAPGPWLSAIKVHVKKNNLDIAKASLALFKKKYPKTPIPEELKPLLK